MTTEAIKYVISADDKAGPVFNNLKGQVAGANKELAASAKTAKGVGEAFGVASSAVGQFVPQLGALSSSLGMANSYFAKLSETANAGGLALAAMKTVGVVALSSAVVTGTRLFFDYVMGLKAVTEAAKEASNALTETQTKLLKTKDDNFANWLKDVQAFETPEGQDRMFENFKLAHEDEFRALDRKQQVLREIIAEREAEAHWFDDMIGNTDVQVASHKEALALLEAEEAALQRQVDTIKQLQIDQERQNKLNAIKEKEQAEEAAAQASKQRAKEEYEGWRKQEREQMSHFNARQETLKKQEEEKKKWREAEKKQFDEFAKAQESKLKEQQSKQEATRSILSGLKAQVISATRGEAAGRAFELGESGLDAGLANQIAQIEKQIKDSTGGVKVNTAAESRLLTGRIEMDTAKLTANATVASQKALERATKQLDQLLAKQDQLIRNTESQLEVLK